MHIIRHKKGHYMELAFIRHGKTSGNMQSRYIGVTDEELCKEGREEIINNLNLGIYPAADIVFASPMKRCIQTAEIIYPGIKLYLEDEFKEIDFGIFEGKNYCELDGSKEYQEWIGSGGKKGFPGGEAREEFSRRCINGFKKALSACWQVQVERGLKKELAVSFIVHGGTIMSVMESLISGDNNAGTDNYFNYQCGNGHGYICRITENEDNITVKGVYSI